MAKTRFIPLGGVGEFGANAAIVQTETTTVLIDYGLMFPPDTSKPGVDYYVHDWQTIMQLFPELSAVFVTHGHEDHIGGLPHLLPNVPLTVYTTPYTATLIRGALENHRHQTRFREVRLNDAVTHGDISVEFVGVTHSIVHACALHIETPWGTILHSGDFKVDPLPRDGHVFQTDRFRYLGDRGIDLLVMDSTNSQRSGFSPAEDDLLPDLEREIRASEGRVYITTFSSHMPRIKKLKALAEQCGRVLCLVGRSLERHYKAAIGAGYFDEYDAGVVSVDQARDMPENRVLFVITGSQGETASSLVRMQRESFRGLRFNRQDTVIFSSRAIPGNERKIALLTGSLEAMGVRVVTPRESHVHTSGHGHREDLAYLLNLTRPKAVAPIHGEFHHLLTHFRWLQKVAGEETHLLLIEDGDAICLDGENIFLGDKIRTELVPIDGNQNVPLSRAAIRDRKNMMYSGFILIACSFDREGKPQFSVEGYGLAGDPEDGFLTYIDEALSDLKLQKSQSDGAHADRILDTAREALRGVFFGKPTIKVVVNGKIY